MKSVFTLLFLSALLFSQSVTAQINHEWSFNIGSKDSEGSGGSVVDHEGSIYILMEMKDTVDVDPGPATVEIIPETETSWILTKYDANGNLVFGNAFFTDDNSGGAVMEAKYNHVRLSINFHDSLIYVHNNIRETIYHHPGNHSAIITTDLDGNIVDSYFFSAPDGYYTNSLYTFPDGRLLVAGAFNDTLVFNPLSPIKLISAGLDDGFFMMLDANYYPLWYQQLKGIADDYIESFTVKEDQQVYFAAGFEDTLRVTTTSGPLELVSAGEDDGLFGTISVAGEFEKLFSVKGLGSEEVRDITVDADGNMYICGYFEQTVNFAHPAQAPSIRTATAEGDGYIAKYDENGYLDWLGIYRTTDYAGVHNIVLKRNDELYVTGIFTDRSDLYPGPDSIIVNTGYRSSPFISKLKTNGDLLWSIPFLTNEVAGIREISVLTEDSRIVVNGFFYDSLHCGTVAGENWLNTDYGADCFVASYSEENVVTANHEIQSQFDHDLFQVFPNPTVDNITVRSGEKLMSVELYSSSGYLVNSFRTTSSNEMNLNLSGLPQGVYFIKATSMDKVSTQKFIKE